VGWVVKGCGGWDVGAGGEEGGGGGFEVNGMLGGGMLGGGGSIRGEGGGAGRCKRGVRRVVEGGGKEDG